MAESDLDVLPIFREENIVREEVSGLQIEPDGSWEQNDDVDTEGIIKRFVAFEASVASLSGLCAGKISMTVDNGDIMIEKSGTQSFDAQGHIPEKLYECPCCGKKVEKLLDNGYCSKTCAMRSRAEKSKAGLSAAGERTLAIIASVKEKLGLLDMALNIITMMPQILRDSAKLPQEYRDYVTMRVEILFLKLKKIVNNIETARNEKLMELMKKLKFGSIDETLSVVLAPVNAVISVVVGLQQSLNAAVAAIMPMLKNPALGALGPNGGHGFMLTAKSIQYPLTSGKILIENKPTVNAVVPLPSMLNTIDTEKIDAIIKKALPPIQDIEYFLDPDAFKLRYALSSDNAPRVKKMIDMLEFIVVQCPGECFPRYRHLKLTRVFFVLAILTGWGPLSRNIFGDFIFHGTI